MIHEKYMNRCLELARMGAGSVAPNPMVGAVLVNGNRIIGEGFHQKYGEAHAEVNCIHSVSEPDHKLIQNSTLYVSLEPCSHFGKTPPCTDIILKYNIPKLVIGCRDPFKEVDGKGIEKLKAASVEVEFAVLENECKDLNKRFFTFHTQQRPFIILKWAQTADKKIAGSGNNRLLISNEFTNHVVHKWRSEEASILVGTNTALVDNPELTTRLWPGPSPVRLVVDMDLSLPKHLHLMNGETTTIVFNTKRHDVNLDPFTNGVKYYQVAEDVSLIHEVSNALYRMNIQSVLVEGGARLLQSFIDEGLWDEARIITNEELKIGDGLNAPSITMAEKIATQQILNDKIEIYKQAT